MQVAVFYGFFDIVLTTYQKANENPTGFIKNRGISPQFHGRDIYMGIPRIPMQGMWIPAISCKLVRFFSSFFPIGNRRGGIILQGGFLPTVRSPMRHASPPTVRLPMRHASPPTVRLPMRHASPPTVRLPMRHANNPGCRARQAVLYVPDWHNSVRYHCRKQPLC
jgi:hypothetical protein